MQSDEGYSGPNDNYPSDDTNFYDDEDNDDYYHSEGHIRDFPEPCDGDQCQNWINKIKDFQPSYRGGGGGGGGATFIFKVNPENPSQLIPLLIAGKEEQFKTLNFFGAISLIFTKLQPKYNVRFRSYKNLSRKLFCPCSFIASTTHNPVIFVFSNNKNDSRWWWRYGRSLQ